MKVNVLYVIWSLGLGGAEQVVIRLAKGLDKSRFQVFVCCLNDEGAFADELRLEGIKVIALHKKSGIDFGVVGKIIKVLKANDIHILHGHLWGGNLWGRIAARIAKTPVVVVTEHNMDVWKKWYHKFIDRFLARWTDKIVVVSHKVKKFYETQVGIDAKKLEIIYNGIAPDSIVLDARENRKLKESLHVNNNKPVLVNIGRLVEAKANHIFLEALRTLERKQIDFNALIIGEGPLKESLISQSQDLIKKNLVKFTGLRKDVSKILKIANISVLSSTREGFSVVVLESMAKGIPFVATNVGGNDEQIVDGKTGFLTPANDSAALANAIEKVLKNPNLAKQMGCAARKRLTDYFSLDIMIKNTEDLYDRNFNFS